MQIVTPKGETAYVNLFRPQKAMDPSKPDQYSVTLLFDENDPKVARLQEAILSVATAKFGASAKAKLASGQLKNPLRPGSDKQGTSSEEEFAGKYFITCRSTDKPEVVDENLETFMDTMGVYSGCFGRADIYLYAFDQPTNKGVSCILNSFQKLADGERKSGRRSASSAFGEDDPLG